MHDVGVEETVYDLLKLQGLRTFKMLIEVKVTYFVEMLSVFVFFKSFCCYVNVFVLYIIITN